MNLSSFLGVAAGLTLLFGAIKRYCVKTARQKVAVEIAYMLSYVFLTATWFSLFFESEGETRKRILSIVMIILTSLVSLFEILTSIVYALEYHFFKEVRNAEDNVKKLKKMYNKVTYTKNVGVNKVIECLTDFCQKNIENSKLVTSTKQLFNFYLPEYVKVYSQYVKTVTDDCINDSNLQEMLAAKMTECSEVFMKRIDEAKEEQKAHDEEIKDAQVSTKSSEFEATADVFNAMAELDARTVLKQ